MLLGLYAVFKFLRVDFLFLHHVLPLLVNFLLCFLLIIVLLIFDRLQTLLVGSLKLNERPDCLQLGLDLIMALLRSVPSDFSPHDSSLLSV